MARIMSFLKSDKFGSFLSIATMLSKYVIAVLLLLITWEWNYLVPFLLSIVGSFLIGIAFAYIAPSMTWLAKYVVTVAELAILQWYSQAITKSLVLTIIFMLPFLMMVVSETVKNVSKDRVQNKILSLIGGTGDKLYGVERVFRLTLGAYFSFVFGLQSLVNECVLLWSFGLIGAVEIDAKALPGKVKAFCHKCTRIRVVFVPEGAIMAAIYPAFESDMTEKGEE